MFTVCVCCVYSTCVLCLKYVYVVFTVCVLYVNGVFTVTIMCVNCDGGAEGKSICLKSGWLGVRDDHYKRMHLYHCRCGMHKKSHCSMAMIAKLRSKFAALHCLW